MKNVIFLGIGLVTGAGIGVLATRGYYKKMAIDEIREIRDIHRKQIAAKEKADKNSEMKDDFLREHEENSSKNTQNDEKKLVKLTEKEEKREDLRQFEKIRKPYIHNYNVFTNPINEDEMDDYDDPYDYVVEHESPSDGYSEPFLISEEEFASEKLFYDKVIINYYSDGIAVLDETDEIVEQIEELIGPDILNEKTGNEELDYTDTIYVRNDSRSTDYGIIFMNSEFVQEEEPD